MLSFWNSPIQFHSFTFLCLSYLPMMLTYQVLTYHYFFFPKAKDNSNVIRYNTRYIFNRSAFISVSETTRSSCPVLTINNGVRVGRDTHYGAEVAFQCGRGFYMTGNPKRVCVECGRWSGKKTRCQMTRWFRQMLSTTEPPIATESSNNLTNYINHAHLLNNR